ncbi:4-aminobutyrate--2-oxoglutarate transaminase [Campylobacter sp. MIT 21-1685]|uniref:4-aminobutyrate--2-oxoglutarate transaminase n=1 Tax=unclassified Campylobacter TaxID=2593542 RepID=UPI00224A92BF|nr:MULTISPECIES: 4-aminobutyrate--2-oxoglutarate transaminase [unclassified Campylobacter]MCX2682262.1 4-aminobutyrate--2-oxoglutarate transaminase [Campylobacter sp. MIT 21-1684]MCX2750543.1 4-aminobutyrate--2-oxoglutarate transaminase [Campylobacter sp. MIT 21-1682]MCX2806909.1 4-aminobutyrate--2-oxoglutarate transaminase [Campylobacter sp. MIT 21-1685]
MKDLTSRRLEATPKAIGITCDWFIQEANNATLISTDGKEFIDFASGIAVLNVGHRHPKVVEAVKMQLDKFTHSAYQVTPYESYVELAEAINKIAPIHSKKKTCFFTTGGEATENAIKIAKAYTKRYGVIAFGGSFHGRTSMAVSVTGKVAPYKSEIGMGMPGVYHALYPNKLYGISVKDSLRSIEHICKSSISPYDVSAIIFEPVQGEGGFNVAPKEFITELRKFCDEYGIVMIADEVQTGFARTGKTFAMEYFDESVDLICIAKSLGGGFPLSGIVGKADIMDTQNPGAMGGTYAGNPLATTAALEVLKIIEEEKLNERAQKLGEQLQNTLKKIQIEENITQIAQVRGLGSMVAVEFFEKDVPSAEFAKRVQKEAMQRGVVLLTCGSYGNVIRFLYPLTIPQEQFDKALSLICDSLKKAAQ